MKKSIIAILSVVMLFAFTACGSSGEATLQDSAYLGTWTGTTASYSGIDMNVTDIYEGGFTITLASDGSYEVIADGETDTGTWEETETGFKISVEEDVLEFVVDGNNATLDYEGVIMNFEKQ